MLVDEAIANEPSLQTTYTTAVLFASVVVLKSLLNNTVSTLSYLAPDPM